MRAAFIDQLITIAGVQKNVMLLTGDLGYKVFDQFRKNYADRFINVGVAESFLIGAATGLALEGKIPVCYSIAPFLTMRPFEFIRNDICFHHANVKLVAVGGGYSYGPNGASHHALNDVALMSSLPEMTVLTPADTHEARWAIEAAIKIKGPVYIRLGRSGELPVHESPITVKLGKSIVLSEGKDVAILVSGFILSNALIASEQLVSQGISVRLVSFPSIKPIDEAAIHESFKTCKVVATIEEHGFVGGFGSIVMQKALAKKDDLKKFIPIYAPDETLHVTGSQAYLQQIAGLSPEAIVDKILKKLEK